jgi:ATP-binding cassette subfamily B protein
LATAIGATAAPLPNAIDPTDDAHLGRWLTLVATQHGLEVEPVRATYGDVEPLVRGAGPALLRVPAPDPTAEVRFFALLRSGTRQAVVIKPDLTTSRLPVRVISAALCALLEQPHRAMVDALLQDAATPPYQQAAARTLLLTEYLGAAPVNGCWLLRPTPGHNLWSQVRRSGLLRPALTILGGYLLLQAVTIGAWAIIGRSALAGQFVGAWLLGWALLLLTALPLQMAVGRALSQLAVGMGALFKQRLLYGITHLEPEAIRQGGAGQFLGRVLDADAVEQLALTGGFTALLALIQLGVAGAILALGAESVLHALLLLVWSKVALCAGPMPIAP